MRWAKRQNVNRTKDNAANLRYFFVFRRYLSQENQMNSIIDDL